MLKKAGKVIMLADHSKIGHISFVNVGPVADIHILITDDKAPSDEIDKIRQSGVEVIVV